MASTWHDEFRQRMVGFSKPGSSEDEFPISIKVRVSSGCFHREHSPIAYAEIDNYLLKHSITNKRLCFIEHESGPEVLVYLAVTTAGLTLAKSVVDLITAILKARSEGIKKGDKPEAPLEVIIRGYDNKNEYVQEIVLRVDSTVSIDSTIIKKAIEDAIKKLPTPPKKKKRRK